MLQQWQRNELALQLKFHTMQLGLIMQHFHHRLCFCTRLQEVMWCLPYHAISHFWNWALWMRGRFDQEPKGTMHTRAKQMGGCSAKDESTAVVFSVVIFLYACSFFFDNLRVCLLTNLSWFVMSQWCRSKSVQKSYLRSRIKIVFRVCNRHLGLSKGQSQWNLELYGC